MERDRAWALVVMATYGEAGGCDGAERPSADAIDGLWWRG
jgi:hypothetical protein